MTQMYDYTLSKEQSVYSRTSGRIPRRSLYVFMRTQVNKMLALPISIKF